MYLNGQPHVEEAGPPPEDASAGPTIFGALRTLGLKLVPGKATFQVIVVDDAKQPAEN